jgi:hypothetical protein
LFDDARPAILAEKSGSAVVLPINIKNSGKFFPYFQK